MRWLKERSAYKKKETEGPQEEKEGKTRARGVINNRGMRRVDPSGGKPAKNPAGREKKKNTT